MARKSKKDMYYDDEFDYISDKRTKKKNIERQKNKRMKNAIRNMNVEELYEIEEQDEFL